MAPNPMSLSHHSETYSLYGLTVRSAIALPCPRVEQAMTPPDVALFECGPAEIVQACRQERISFQEDGFWQSSIFVDGSAHVAWKEHFEFVVSADAKKVL